MRRSRIQVFIGIFRSNAAACLKASGISSEGIQNLLL